MRHLDLAAHPFIDAAFVDALKDENLDYPQVALQAAHILRSDEIQGLQQVSREDGMPCIGSQNYLELARFITLVATLGWETRLGEGAGYDSAMGWAVESLAHTVRTTVFVPGNTLEDMMRLAANNMLRYIWDVKPKDRYAWTLSMQALSTIPEEDIFKRDHEQVMARVRHMLSQAQAWLDEGPWTAVKQAELVIWAEMAFSGFTEPSDEAKDQTKREIKWVTHFRNMRVSPQTAAQTLALFEEADREEVERAARGGAFSASELRL
jgi:hypothetical protein